MSDSRPIGVFDSGLGGLTVVRELMRLMPDERVVYLGDTARCPYGNRSDETIIRFGIQDALFLVKQEIKMLIVACNTVSSVALDTVRAHVDKEIPVIGVVLPGARAAATHTAEQKVGLIGTHATVRAGAYQAAIKGINNKIKVYQKACPLFVPLVEEGMTTNDIARQICQYELYELVDAGIDCLILGCTHYPLLMEVIQETVGTRIQLIDSAYWTAKEARDILTALGAGADGTEMTESIFYVTDRTPHFSEQAGRFLGRAVSGVELVSMETLSGSSV